MNAAACAVEAWRRVRSSIARELLGDTLGMKPEKMTVLEVFQRERRLCVPLFQRAYVWTSEQQWEPLWEDIVRQANMHMAQTDPQAIRTHFLGAIVINIASVQGRSVARADVIDGQQRLTT